MARKTASERIAAQVAASRAKKLKSCPACRHEVSKAAKNCPNCGHVGWEGQVQDASKGLMSCGCLGILFVTIPIVLFFLYALFVAGGQ